MWFFRDLGMMKRGKKSQGMPINVIIIAALAMIVFIVLVVLFTGRVGLLAKDLESCATKQGRCDKDCGPNGATVPAKCSDAEEKEGKKKCCITVFRKSDNTKISSEDQKAGP